MKDFFKSALTSSPLVGDICIPGDKSISHRAMMLGSLAKGKTIVKGFLNSEDCLHTKECFSQMGVKIEKHGTDIVVHGVGLHGLELQGKKEFDVGNSGTTIRLISGILCAQKFDSVISGDASICKRPMDRIIKPLQEMDAEIVGQGDRQYPPLTIKGGKKLKAIKYLLPVASAQVKSCVLLAGLYADGVTTVIEPVPTRDHTELMLRYMGADIKVNKNEISISSKNDLCAKEINVPADISSAAFFIVAGLIVKNSKIILKNIGNNPRRNGILKILKNMGANIRIFNEQMYGYEPVADIEVCFSNLKGIKIGGKIIPNIIDEIPIIAVAAAMAQGTTEISDAKELRVKESDRIAAMTKALKACGVDVQDKPDGMIIHGKGSIEGGATIDSLGDHRIAMSMSIAGLVAKKPITVNQIECVNTSFPGFYKLVSSLQC